MEVLVASLVPVVLPVVLPVAPVVLPVAPVVLPVAVRVVVRVVPWVMVFLRVCCSVSCLFYLFLFFSPFCSWSFSSSLRLVKEVVARYLVVEVVALKTAMLKVLVLRFLTEIATEWLGKKRRLRSKNQL